MADARRRAIPKLRLVAAAVAMLLWCGGVAAAAPAGTVVGIAGSCFVESGGRRAPLSMGQPVQIGDVVEAPADGKLKLRMTDGSIVSVAAGSRLTVASYTVEADGHRVEGKLSLAQGLLRAVVAPSAAPASFEVDTAVGAAAARGTDWFVEAFPGSMQVGVLDGKVSLTSGTTRRSETVPARWGARLEAGRDPVPPRLWAPAEFQAVIGRTTVP